MSQENIEIVPPELIKYAKDLEQIILDFGKYDMLTRKMYERKIKNLAQLSIIKGIDIDDIAKEINQEKNNSLIIEKFHDETKKIQTNFVENEKDINNIEINDISKQIFCKDFYKKLSKFLDKKKESLKILNILNNNKNNYNNNMNKYKNQNQTQNEQYNIIDNNKKINNISYNSNHSKSGSKNLGRKRKNK